MEVLVGAGVDGEGRTEVEGATKVKVGSAGVEEEGAAESCPLALDLRVPGNVIEGSSRF